LCRSCDKQSLLGVIVACCVLLLLLLLVSAVQFARHAPG